jgi:hypothetical protein
MTVTQTLVYGYCFNLNHTYPTINGDIDGWTFLHQIIPKYLEGGDTTLKSIKIGDSRNEDSFGLCVAISVYGSSSNSCGINVPLDIFHEILQVNHSEYISFLKNCGIANRDSYKPKLMVVYNH